MSDCIFCRIINHELSAHVVYEDKSTIAFLDKYPKTRGHLQLVPKQHARWIYDIPDIGSFFVTAQKIIRGIIPVLEADHVRIATFGDEVFHAHLWIIPYYKEASREHFEANSPSELAQLLQSALQSQKS